MRNRPTGSKTDSSESSQSNEALGVIPMEAGQIPGGASGQPPQSPDMPLVSDNPIIASSAQKHEEANVPPPQAYKVVTGGTVMYRGNRVIIRVGKILDSRAYDIAVLTDQGIKLEPATE